MDLMETSRHTVDELLARRHQPMSYEERVQYALDLVDLHLHEENPDRIDECIRLSRKTRCGTHRRAASAMSGGSRSR